MTHRELPIIHIKLFKANQPVSYKGESHVVEYIQISKGRLLVKLYDMTNLVTEYDIECDLTKIDFNLPYVLGLRDGRSA
jgi:hypothetical protein